MWYLSVRMTKSGGQSGGAADLEATLAAAPDPERARKLAARLLEVADPERLADAPAVGVARVVDRDRYVGHHTVSNSRSSEPPS